MGSVFELCPTTYINLTNPRCTDRSDSRSLNAWAAAYNDAYGQGSRAGDLNWSTQQCIFSEDANLWNSDIGKPSYSGGTLLCHTEVQLSELVPGLGTGKVVVECSINIGSIRVLAFDSFTY